MVGQTFFGEFEEKVWVILYKFKLVKIFSSNYYLDRLDMQKKNTKSKTEQKRTYRKRI